MQVSHQALLFSRAFQQGQKNHRAAQVATSPMSMAVGQSPAFARRLSSSQPVIVPARREHFASQVVQVAFGQRRNTLVGIPVVDFSDYTSADTTRRDAFVQALGDGLRETGFVALKGHGIDPALYEQNYGALRKTFELPEEIRQRYMRPEAGYQRGYLPAIERKAAQHGGVKNIVDKKEAWQMGAQANLFPDEQVPEFRTVNESLFHQLESVGIGLVKALDEYLEADGYLTSLVEDENGRPIGTHMMRNNYYPSLNVQPGQPLPIRAGEHKDLNLITLLPQSTNEGLQIQRKDGSWQSIHAQEGMIIVNSADLLAYITKGHKKEIPSTLHRVVSPSRKVAGQQRFSIPLFISPNFDKPLRNLATGEIVRAYGREIDRVGKFTHARLQRHGALDPSIAYETWRATNAPFIER